MAAESQIGAALAGCVLGCGGAGERRRLRWSRGKAAAAVEQGGPAASKASSQRIGDRGELYSGGGVQPLLRDQVGIIQEKVRVVSWLFGCKVEVQLEVRLQD